MYLLFFKKIEKSIMAPMISNSRSKDTKADILDKNLNKERNELLKLRNYIENNFEYGKRFL